MTRALFAFAFLFSFNLSMAADRDPLTPEQIACVNAKMTFEKFCTPPIKTSQANCDRIAATIANCPNRGN